MNQKYEVFIHTSKSVEKDKEEHLKSVKTHKQPINQSCNELKPEQDRKQVKSQDCAKSNHLNFNKMQTNSNMDQDNKTKKDIGRLSIYKSDEESLICRRFPHLKICGCGFEDQNDKSIQINEHLFLGGIQQAIGTKELLRQGITHILNLSSSEYYKRTNYFTYLNIDVYDNNDEDIKKNFRITNRFIQSAVQQDGKILVHDQGDYSRAGTFILAFFISYYKISLKQGLEKIKKIYPIEISTYFIKQLEQYDLEKLAYQNLKTIKH